MHVIVNDMRRPVSNYDYDYGKDSESDYIPV